MDAGYFDRRAESFTALCEPCGNARWGDPFDPLSDAFGVRLADQSGEWCWTGGLGGGVGPVACSECGQ